MMKEHYTPIYFPTKVAVIDDDIGFLSQIRLVIDDDLPCEVFSSPRQALQAIRGYQDRNGRLVEQFSRKWGVGTGDNEYALDDEHENLHRFITDEQRFDRYSVMVVDYAMPEMTGIELCKAVTDPWIKKILITGKADSDVAIQAFNSGIIDRFIRKEEDDLDVRINDQIHELSREFFADICTTKAETRREMAHLYGDSFAQMFMDICRQEHIVEYYLKRRALLNEFLMVTRHGEVRILLVQTPEQAIAQQEIANENPAMPEELRSLIREQRVVPYFNGWCDYDASHALDWREHVYPAQSQHAYVYALVDKERSKDFCTGRVEFCYERFLEGVQPVGCLS